MMLPAERFDGAQAWSRLTDEERAAIGAAALENAVAFLGQCKADASEDFRVDIAYETAMMESDAAMTNAAADALERIGAVPVNGLPPVPKSAGRLCRECGCTDARACMTSEGPCSWAEDDLCSACAPAVKGVPA